MNLVNEFIKYKWQAKGRHGIHSPFVYDFIGNVLQTSFEGQELNVISSYTHFLKKCHDEIEFQELGAGSKLLSNKRRVSSMYSLSSSRGKFGKLLYALVSHYSPKQIVEFGSSLGVGTLHLALSNPLAKIQSIEGCSNTHAFTVKSFPKKLSNVEFINSTFEEFCQQKSESPIDLLFIDGHHDGKYLLTYLDQLNPRITENTLVVLDDIRWSSSMLETWNKLVADKKYHVSIDLFRMGILLKKPDQVKQHFILRY